MSQITKAEFAAQIVDQMGDEDKACYRREDWADGLGMQMEGDEDYSLEELLDAVDDLIVTEVAKASLTCWERDTVELVAVEGPHAYRCSECGRTWHRDDEPAADTALCHA